MAQIYTINKNDIYKTPSGSNVSLIPPPQSIAPPVVQPAGGSYTVQPGDTLSAIATKMRTTIDKITGYASGNPNLIKPGEVLRVGAESSPASFTGIDATKTPAPKNPLADITSIDTYKGVMAGVDTAQTDYNTAAKKLGDTLTPINSADIMKTKSVDQKVEAKSQAVLDAETLLNNRRAEWEKNIQSLESQPGVLMPVIAGQQAQQLKLANIDLARLEADVSAKKGNYQDAYNLAKYAADLEVQTKQDERSTASTGLTLAESKLNQANQKKVDFVTNYLKQTQPDLQVRTETNDNGDLTVIGINPKDGSVRYQKTFKRVGATKKSTAPSINDLPEDQMIFVNKVQNAINVGDSTYDDAVSNFPAIARYLKPKSSGY